MKKKVGIIASSVATIAVCSSMIVGSTFALFTSEDKVDVAITSGNVEVTAVAKNLKTDYDDEHLTAGNVNASLEGNTVTLDKMLPGDIVSFDVEVTNTSTVDIKYRTSITCEEGIELMSGLDFTIGEDNTYNGLVKYATGWNEWEGEDTKTVTITVSLPWDAGNEYANLSCKFSYAIEAVQGNAIKDDAAEVVEYKVSTAEELTKALKYASENGGIITLTDNITLNASNTLNEIKLTGDAVINLNKKTLETAVYENKYVDFVVSNGASIVFQNGNLEFETVQANLAAISVLTDSSLKLENVVLNTNGTGLFPSGDAAKVEVINSTINATNIDGGYSLGTNASGPENYGVIVECKNSVFTSYGTAIIVNVPGTYNFDNCTIEGQFHGFVARGGDVTLSNCSITNTMDVHTLSDGTTDLLSYFETHNWADGNTINLAALTLGNKNGTAYDYPTNCKLVNTTVTAAGQYGYTNSDKSQQFPAIYVYGYSETSPTTLTYEAENVNGIVSLNGSYNVKTIDLVISTVADLQAFAEDVNSGNNYAGKLVVLANDIDLSGINWTPIGFDGKVFKGTFDGLGHTISNLTAVYEDRNNVALFGSVQGGSKTAVIKNVNLENVTVQGVDCVGSLVGQGVCKVENVNVENASVTGGHYVGGVVGYGYAYIYDCTISNSTVIGNPYIENNKWDNGDKVGGLVGYLCAADAENCTVSNTTVKAWRDLGGVVGAVNNSDGHTCKVLGNKAENVTVEYVVHNGFTTQGDQANENLGIIYGRYVNGSLDEAIENGYVQVNE